MIQYRLATKSDAEKIAHIHAHSWQINYKGILTDEYLNNNVFNDRMSIWKQRFESPKKNQHVILAEDKNKIIGFACTYLKEDKKWGALLDNLHVIADWKGQGIGRELMRRSALWVNENDPNSNFYLLVLKNNKAAIQFYEKLGGIKESIFAEKLPDGEIREVFRYVWTDLKILIR